MSPEPLRKRLGGRAGAPSLVGGPYFGALRQTPAFAAPPIPHACVCGNVPITAVAPAATAVILPLASVCFGCEKDRLNVFKCPHLVHRQLLHCQAGLARFLLYILREVSRCDVSFILRAGPVHRSRDSGPHRLHQRLW